VTLTAHAPTRDILTSLARAGWGEISGSEHKGTRAMLRALVDLLPYGSGEGLVTAPQLADVSGYSERWVRSRLSELEALGLILWRRGGVVAVVLLVLWSIVNLLDSRPGRAIHRGRRSARGGRAARRRLGTSGSPPERNRW
jgi:DNA-binding FadR family transcriptional regulator